MILKEFIENLNEFVKENPESLELLVVSSSDDEGNSFNQVIYTPSLGHYDHRDFTISDNSDEISNAVCIN